MRRRHSLVAAGLIAASLPFAINAGVADAELFYGCTSSAPFTNFEGAVATLTPDAPTGTMGSGSGGCAAGTAFAGWAIADTAGSGYEYATLTAEGTYEGAIDSVDLHQYAGTLASNAAGSISAQVVVTVDGEVVFENVTADSGLDLVSSEAGPFPGTGLFEGTITDLGVEEGEHDVRIEISLWAANDVGFLMYGAEDAASGITVHG